MNATNTVPQAPPESNRLIETVSAWVLRLGVILSVAVMITGMVFTFARHPPSAGRMSHDPFEYRPRLIWHGVRHGSGKAIIEIGIYLLLFTPITRVFMSAILFAVQRDRLYALITFLVLLLTLAGLLFLK